MKIKNTKTRTLRVVLYVVLILLAFLMLVPFAWMLSASFKLDKDVFIFPIQWIPTNPRWQNYLAQDTAAEVRAEHGEAYSDCDFFAAAYQQLRGLRIFQAAF